MLFAEIAEVRALGMTIDVPVPASVNVPSLILTLAALVALFHLKIGMIPVLAACAALGVAYHLVGGAI